MKALFWTARCKCKSHVRKFIKDLLTTPISFLQASQIACDPIAGISIGNNLLHTITLLASLTSAMQMKLCSQSENFVLQSLPEDSYLFY